MSELALAAKVFYTGIAGVFLVMIILQISIGVTSIIVNAMSKPKEE